jgi:hypothetical protein
VTRCDGMVTLVRGEAAPGRRRHQFGLTQILRGQKMKKIHAVDLAATKVR